MSRPNNIKLKFKIAVKATQITSGSRLNNALTVTSKINAALMVNAALEVEISLRQWPQSMSKSNQLQFKKTANFRLNVKASLRSNQPANEQIKLYKCHREGPTGRWLIFGRILGLVHRHDGC